jgi:hypothetical protein
MSRKSRVSRVCRGSPVGRGSRRSRVGLTRAGLALLCRPRLWPAAARLVPNRWWRRWPPRPWPPPAYVHFRTETMYGARGRIDPGDLVNYLEWCRRMGRSAR